MAGSVTGIKAGRAFILIDAVDATGKVLNNIRSKLGKFGTELSSMGRTMAMRTAAALLPVGLAVRTGTEYDDIMRKVSARSEGTAEDMDLLREQTLKLGRTLGILPTQMGKIQDVFATAGFTRSEIAKITPAVATLARAGTDTGDVMEDVGNAAKAVSSILRGFQMDASMAAEVSDKLAIAVKQSNFSLEDITTSLSYAVPAAKNFNIPLDHMLSVLGAMRDLQIHPSMVGTAFRNIANYMSQTKEQEKFNENLQKLTGNTIKFTDASKNLKDPYFLLPAIMKATEKLGTAERSDLITQLLEMRASVPAQAAGSSVKRLAEMTTLLKNWRGAAKAMQEEMDAGLGGAFRRFSASVQTLAIQLQKALAPSLGVLTKLLETNTDTVTKWIGDNLGLVVGIGASVSAFGLLGVALIGVGQAMLGLTPLFTLASALTGIVSTLLTFVTPWALAAAGIYLANQAITEFVSDAGDPMKAVGVAADVLKDKLCSVADTIRGEFAKVGSHLHETWGKSIDIILRSLQSGQLENALKVLWANMKVTWQEGINFFMDKWDEMLNNMAGIKSQSGGWFPDLLEKINDAQRALAGGVQEGPSLFSPEYIQSLRDTYVARFAESQNDPARAAAAAQRKEKLDSLKSDLSWERAVGEADIAIANADALLARLKTSTGVTDASAAVEALTTGANALIGPASIPLGTMPKANEALERGSTEAAKAFQESKFDVYQAQQDQALKIAEEQKRLLESIDAKVGQPALGGV